MPLTLRRHPIIVVTGGRAHGDYQHVKRVLDEEKPAMVVQGECPMGGADALAARWCRENGWWLRQDIIWAKPNPMPESVRDRCTKAHEYLFLLSKGPRYYYDADAIMEGLPPSSIDRLAQNVERQRGSDRVPGKTNGTMKAVSRQRGIPPRHAQYPDSSDQSGLDSVGRGMGRNKRSVWTVATQPFSGAHFATFPPALIEPCILAGCPKDGTVLDPFGG